MAVFEYRGILVTTGKAVKGVRDAENAKALRTALRRDGILLTTATEEQAAAAKTKRDIKLFAFAARPSTNDVAVMTRQLATLIRAGIPLFESLSALIDQTEKESLKRALTQIREQVREGIAFAKALEAHPSIFPPLYINMVRAGEASGTMTQVLERITSFLEAQAKLKGKVSSALAYPILMIILGTAMVSGLMIGVVPNVTSIFASMDQALPWYTSVLIGFSDFVGSFWWLVLLMLAVGIWGFRRWVRTPAGRLKFDSFLLRAPLIGKLTKMIAIARFSRTLATLLSAGVALLPAMDIVKNVLGNAALEKVVVDAISSIREGQSIAEPLKRSGQFPPIVTHMITIGEKSGQLEEMLENVANAYDLEVETRVTMLTSLLEPLIIVGMGLSVGFIAFSILMPLIQMSSFAG
ncbi:type II secretion system inner membrane protein GspF [Polyangium aurulentum]|uniref:type II secretion system inner membrane protein GspF n=1 Tax=Polyangium aurulentum TaxID=2567896 RepID=UPI0010AEBFBB|nr:type II secretion system inner membrane protein GspF [Polyangium aurulentum]UQA60813.1 type II secretion system inner membrane protein GspF [Polyangium aurulentum]